MMTHKALKTSQPTNAIYRVIDKGEITLFIDEIDKLNADTREEFNGILNQGYSARSGGILKMVGNTFEPKQFDVYCPKAFAGINKDSLTQTLRSRSLPIDLQKADNVDELEKFIWTPYLDTNFDMEVQVPLSELKKNAEEFPYWDTDHYIDCIYLLGDVMTNSRGADITAPLLAIATMGSYEWAEKSLKAFNHLTVRDVEEQTWKVELLSLCREIMHKDNENYIFSQSIASRVNDFLDSRFTNWNNGNGINQNNVAKALKEFGIESKTVRIGADTKKGYEWNAFLKPFKTYLLLEEPQLEEDDGKDILF